MVTRRDARLVVAISQNCFDEQACCLRRMEPVPNMKDKD